MNELQTKYLKWRYSEEVKYIYFDISNMLNEEQMLTEQNKLFNVILMDPPSITVHLCSDFTNSHASKKYLLNSLLLYRKLTKYKITFYYVGAVGPKKIQVKIFSRLTGAKFQFYESREHVNEEFLKLF